MRLNKKTLISLLLFFALAVSACSRKHYLKREFKTRAYEVDFSYEGFYFFHDILSLVEIEKNKKKNLSNEDVYRAIEQIITGFSYHKSIQKLKNFTRYQDYELGEWSGGYNENLIEFYVNSLKENKIFKKVHVLKAYTVTYDGSKENFFHDKRGKNSRYSITVTNFGKIPSIEKGKIYWNLLIGYQIRDLKTNQQLLKQLRIVSIKVITPQKKVRRFKRITLHIWGTNFSNLKKEEKKVLLADFLDLLTQYFFKGEK